MTSSDAVSRSLGVHHVTFGDGILSVHIQVDFSGPGCLREHGDLRTWQFMLGQFDPVWEHLVSNEKRHVLKTLIEQVTFNGTTSEVEVDVSPSGVRLLSDEERSETA